MLQFRKVMVKYVLDVGRLLRKGILYTTKLMFFQHRTISQKLELSIKCIFV